MRRLIQVILLINFYLQVVFGVLYQAVVHFHFVIEDPLLPFQILSITPSLFWLWLIVYIYSKTGNKAENKLFSPMNHIAETDFGSKIYGGLVLLFLGTLAYIIVPL